MIKSFWLLLIVLVQNVLGEVNNEGPPSDPSFKMFCSRFKGKYDAGKGRSGNKCTVGFELLTEDDKEAMEFCKLWLPYHILKAEPSIKSPTKKISTCVAEVGRVCPSGWNLMRGRCYKLVDSREHYTWQQAEKECSEAHKEGKIIELRTKMVHIWRAFFPILTHVWVRAGQFENQFLKYDEPAISKPALKATALVYESSISYGVSPFSLIRIGREERSMVICEFTPPSSNVEARTASEKWSKVYYPIAVDNKLVMVRGSAHIGRRLNKKENEAEYYCKKLGEIIDIPLIPSKVLLNDQLTSVAAKSAVYSRSQAICRTDKCRSSKLDRIFRKDFTYPCVMEGAKTFCPLPSENDDIHDSVIKGSVVNVHNGMGVRLISDAARAPVMCTTTLPSMTTPECEEPWTPYRRESGVLFCHRPNYSNLGFDDAEKQCQEWGGHLTGFESWDEFMLIMTLTNNNFFWIGSKRKMECTHCVQYDPVCDENEVFEWLHNVASNSNKFFRDLWYENSWWDRIFHRKYTKFGYKQECLAIWDKKIGDHECSTSLQSVCGKPAPSYYIVA